jgi:ribosomal protein S18 acetylase RimI-like enzyme
MKIDIFAATTAEDFRSYGLLIREYVDWLRGRLQQASWFMDQVMAHQSLDQELASLKTKYGPPRGRAFLARIDGEICGGGAYQKMTDDICEMKRLFVRPPFHGRGIGRQLCQTLTQSAVDDGFMLMRLDTARHLTEAIGMYESLGFARCSPYRDYPDELLPYLVFMERRILPP